MQRPIWKGYITFGLVSIPVVLYSAENKSEIQFKLFDSRDKSRIHYVRVNERTGKEVPWKEIAKGYEYGDDEYVLVQDKEIKAIAGENTKAIDIECFINKSSLDFMDFEKPYYLVPDKRGDKGYVILRETLNNTKKVGIAKVMLHTRQYLAVLMTHEDALVLNLLHYRQEMRKPTEFELPTSNLKTYKITTKELDTAKQLVNLMTSKWNPEAYHDEFQDALEEWLEEKIHHEKPTRKKRMAEPITQKNVINFADLLKKSLSAKRTTVRKSVRKTSHKKSSRA